MRRKIKKIALINPKRPLFQESPKIYEMFERNNERLKLWFAPPLSLLTIASLTPKNISIKIIDEHFETIDFSEKYDLVGVTAMTLQAFRAYEISEEFRKRKITVIMGGIHATILPDEVAEHVDTVFVGEAEELWNEYLEDFKSGKEKRIYSSNRPFDMKKSIIPSYELINYEQFNSISSYFKFLPIQATRGCPHDCSFCVTTKFYGRKIRKKEINQIISEISFLKKNCDNSLILFVDDNLFVDHKFAKSLLKELISLKIKYVAQSDVKIADDPELLSLAYQSGCIMILIGFESITPDSLISLNKNDWKMKQVKSYHDSIHRIQENGIIVFGAFVIGFENDDITTFKLIRDFVIANNIPGQFTLLTPLPGSKIYDQCKKEGRLYKEVFWDQCNFFNMTFRHDNLSKDEAENKIIWLHNEVFNEENVLERNMNMISQFKKLSSRWQV